MNVAEILAVSPYLEVVVRNAYWRSGVLIDVLSSFRPTGRKRRGPKTPQISIARAIDNLHERGVRQGDILVVHSAFGAVGLGNTPEAVLRAILDFLGPHGTLVMPTIPVFAGGPSVRTWMTADVSNLVLDYDPSTTPCWTGALPATLMRTAGARRSLHPLNTVTAIGPHAETMLSRNLEGDRPLPCGLGSSWEYCRGHHAKVVALGVDMAHSLTMIHVAEDARADRWCVPGWYRDRRFRIKMAEGWEEVVVRERHPRWAMYYAERTLDRDLRREGVLTVDDLDGVTIGLLDANQLVEYLNSRNTRGYPYYLVPVSR